MKVDLIINGIVIDHISPGKGMEIYNTLNLGSLTDCSVALLNNVVSHEDKRRKDIIKIDKIIDIDMDALGYIDPNVTINIIKDAKIVDKKSIDLPETLTGVLTCKNPRCITSIEQELPHVFKLTDRENKIYRCIYCETQANKPQ